MSISLVLQSLGGEVSLPNGEKVKVKALSLRDIANLTQKYSAELKQLFGIYQEEGSQQALEVAAKVFPDVISHVICVALGEEPTKQNITEIDTIPFPLQIEILHVSGKLTFHTEDALEKCLETIIAIAGGVSSHTNKVTSAIQSSS